MNQSKAMRLFNEKYREDFNPELFKRSEDDIIEEQITKKTHQPVFLIFPFLKDITAINLLL